MTKIFSFCALLSVAYSAFCQDATFLNTNQSLVNLNPSFAGTNGFVRNQFSWRNQWPNITASWQTYNNTFDMYLKPVKGGIAVTAQGDNQGNVLRTRGLGLAYAQHFTFAEGRNKLIPSLEIFYRERTFDITEITFAGSRTFTWSGALEPQVQTTYGDANAGLLFVRDNRLFIGMTVSHINSPHVGLPGDGKLSQRYTFYGSYSFFLSEKSVLQLVYRGMSQDSYRNSQLSANLTFAKHIMAGAGYVNADLVFVNAGYRANTFALLLGYDVTVSKLAGNSAGSWELHASYNLRNKENRKVLTSFEQM